VLLMEELDIYLPLVIFTLGKGKLYVKTPTRLKYLDGLQKTLSCLAKNAGTFPSWSFFRF
jgi:hypothetical protein